MVAQWCIPVGDSTPTSPPTPPQGQPLGVAARKNFVTRKCDRKSVVCATAGGSSPIGLFVAQASAYFNWRCLPCSVRSGTCLVAGPYCIRGGEGCAGGGAGGSEGGWIGLSDFPLILGKVQELPPPPGGVAALSRGWVGFVRL